MVALVKECHYRNWRRKLVRGIGIHLVVMGFVSVPCSLNPSQPVNPSTLTSFLRQAIIDHFLNYFPPKPALKSIWDPSQRTVIAREIARHKPRHSTVNIGRNCSNQVTNPSTISGWVRWFMGFMVYSDVGCLTAIGTHYTMQMQKLAEVSMSKAQSMAIFDGSHVRCTTEYTNKTFPSYY
jgi:hypothetical protein